MAETHHYEPKGSWLLKILIVVLIVVLVASVLYPQRLWNKQDELIAASRARMDNLNNIVQRHYDVHESYVSDVDSLLRFIEKDSILVEQEKFQVDKLSLYDADYDSFLVDFTNNFHFERIDAVPFSGGRQVDPEGLEEIKQAGIDSLVLKMMPKDEYADVIEPVRYALASDKDIYYEWPMKGVEDHSIRVWGEGMIRRSYHPYEDKRVPSKQYLLFMDPDEITTDPITGEPYNLKLNTRLSLEGEIDFTRPRNGEPEDTARVSGQELYTNLFVNKMARAARARLEQDMQKDTTLYEKQLELQGEYFDVEMELFKPGETVTVEANTELNVPVDSVDAYANTDRLRGILYKVQYDSLIRIWTDAAMTREIVEQLQYEERIAVTKVDTIGVTIRPPMGEEISLPSESFFDKLFSVGPIDNPGNIENNDLSWSETR